MKKKLQSRMYFLNIFIGNLTLLRLRWLIFLLFRSFNVKFWFRWLHVLIWLNYFINTFLSDHFAMFLILFNFVHFCGALFKINHFRSESLFVFFILFFSLITDWFLDLIYCHLFIFCMSSRCRLLYQKRPRLHRYWFLSVHWFNRMLSRIFFPMSLIRILLSYFQNIFFF